MLLAKNQEAKCCIADETTDRAVSMVLIGPAGLLHQTRSREAFLREFKYDLLVEEWSALCSFMRIALRNHENEDAAILTLTRMIQMKLSEIKGKSMEELVEMHNEMAKAQGANEVKKFKNLEAGRIAVIKLANAAKPKSKADKAATGGGQEGRPRSGVGKRAKELILAGGSNAEVMETIKKEFPDNSTTPSCIAYYRNALVKEGLIQGGRQKKADKTEDKPADKPAAKPVKGKSKKKAEAEE